MKERSPSLILVQARIFLSQRLHLVDLYAFEAAPLPGFSWKDESRNNAIVFKLSGEFLSS